MAVDYIDFLKNIKFFKTLFSFIYLSRLRKRKLRENRPYDLVYHGSAYYDGYYNIRYLGELRLLPYH